MKKNFFLSALLLVLAFAINFQAMAQATFRDYFQSLVAEKELAGNFSSSKEKFSTTYTLVLGQTNMDKATAQKNYQRISQHAVQRRLHRLHLSLL